MVQIKQGYIVLGGYILHLYILQPCDLYYMLPVMRREGYMSRDTSTQAHLIIE